MAVQWLNKQNCLLAKIWKPSRQHFGFYEDWRKFGNPQKIGEFLKLGVALILRYLVTVLLLMQTKLAKIRSSATRPLTLNNDIPAIN